MLLRQVDIEALRGTGSKYVVEMSAFLYLQAVAKRFDTLQFVQISTMNRYFQIFEGIDLEVIGTAII